MNRLKRRWMPIKSIGTARAVSLQHSLFAMEVMREVIRRRSNFLSMLKLINGCADVGDQGKSPTVMALISSRTNATIHIRENFSQNDTKMAAFQIVL
jgi:hypothetical protein